MQLAPNRPFSLAIAGDILEARRRRRPELPSSRAQFLHFGLDGALRRLLGLNAKMRQYVEGAAFVRGVVDRVGMAEFNAVWTSTQTLPRPREIANPSTWIARVLG